MDKKSPSLNNWGKQGEEKMRGKTAVLLNY